MARVMNAAALILRLEAAGAVNGTESGQVRRNIKRTRGHWCRCGGSRSAQNEA
jgi:hypothetical protein